MFISNNRPSLPLWWKENLVKHQQVSKYYENDSPQNFLLVFKFSIPTKFVRNSHIWAKIYFMFLENVLKQTWNSFNTKFEDQSKSWKNSYQVKQILALFCYLIPPILVYSSVEGLRVNKIVKRNQVWKGLWWARIKKMVPETITHEMSETNSSFHVK